MNKKPKGSFKEEIDKITKEKIITIMDNREKFISAFMAETGLLPSQCQLVERHTTDLDIGSSENIY